MTQDKNDKLLKISLKLALIEATGWIIVQNPLHVLKLYQITNLTP